MIIKVWLVFVVLLGLNRIKMSKHLKHKQTLSKHLFNTLPTTYSVIRVTLDRSTCWSRLPSYVSSSSIAQVSRWFPPTPGRHYPPGPDKLRFWTLRWTELRTSQSAPGLSLTSSTAMKTLWLSTFSYLWLITTSSRATLRCPVMILRRGYKFLVKVVLELKVQEFA